MARPLKLFAQSLAGLLVVGLLALLAWRLLHQPNPAGIGKPTPLFTAKRLDGRGSIALASFHGRPLVVNFFASWCSGCKTEARALERTWQRYRRAGLVVIGVDSTDATSDGRSFAARKGLTYPIVRDPNGVIATDYGTTGVPESFVLDRSGKLVAQIVGPVNQPVSVRGSSFDAALHKVLARNA